MSALYSYVGKVTALNGAVVTYLIGGSTAGCALTTLRRSRRGDWTRIEVGTGEGDKFVTLREETK